MNPNDLDSFVNIKADRNAVEGGEIVNVRPKGSRLLRWTT